MIWPREVSHGSGRDTCDLKKHIQPDSMILHLVKNPAVLWKVDLVVRGGGKRSLAGELLICF